MVFKKTKASEKICIKSHQRQSKILSVTLSNYEDQMIYTKTFGKRNCLYRVMNLTQETVQIWPMTCCLPSQK